MGRHGINVTNVVNIFNQHSIVTLDENVRTTLPKKSDVQKAKLQKLNTILIGTGVEKR